MYHTLPGPDRAYRYIGALSLWMGHLLLIYMIITELGQPLGLLALAAYTCLTVWLVGTYGKIVRWNTDTYHAKIIGLSVVFGVAQVVFWRTYKHP